MHTRSTLPWAWQLVQRRTHRGLALGLAIAAAWASAGALPVAANPVPRTAAAEGNGLNSSIGLPPEAASPAPTVVPANIPTDSANPNTAPGSTPAQPPAQTPNPSPTPTAAPAELPVKLVLRLRERRVYVYRGDRVEISYPVAIGKPSTPTPIGTYRVFQMVKNPIWRNPWTGQVTNPGPNSALGLRWIGFMERSNGIIGFHGTPTVNSIGRAASNGCVRMRNEHVVELFEKVQMGTTVVVEP